MQKKILPVLLLQFVNGMWFALFIPVFPFLVEWFGQWEIFYGILLASYSICQFFAAPLFGRLSDAYGRRPLLVWSQFGTLISFGIFLLALWYGLEWSSAILGVSSILRWVLLSRVVDGVTGGNSSVANAYLSDVTSTQDKTSAFGLMWAMIGLAMIVWPALGSWSMTRGMWFFGPVLLWWWLSLITLVYLIIALPESLGDKERDITKIAVMDSLSLTRRFGLLKSYPSLVKWFVLYAAFGFVFVGYTSTIVFYFKDTLGLWPEQIGYLFAWVGIFLIFHMWFTVRKLANIRTDKKLFLVWLLLVCVSLVWFVIQPGMIGFLIIAFVLDAGIAFVLSSFKWLITKGVSPIQQGSITWLEESVMAANRAITPILATALFAMSGISFYWIAGLMGLLWLIIIKYLDISQK